MLLVICTLQNREPRLVATTCLIRPNVAATRIAQHQLIFQLDMLRLAFVPASMAIDQLIKQQLRGNPSNIFARLAYDADRWAKRRSKFEIIETNECDLLGYVDMQFLKYLVRINGDEILQGEDPVGGIGRIEMTLDRCLRRFVVLNRRIDDGIQFGLLDRLFITSNPLFDGVEIDFST
jgi:hypothetical protein